MSIFLDREIFFNVEFTARYFLVCLNYKKILTNKNVKLKQIIENVWMILIPIKSYCGIVLKFEHKSKVRAAAKLEFSDEEMEEEGDDGETGGNKERKLHKRRSHIWFYFKK